MRFLAGSLGCSTRILFQFLAAVRRRGLGLEGNGGLSDGHCAAFAEWALSPGESTAVVGTSNPIVRDMRAICEAQAAAVGQIVGVESVAFYPLHTSGRMLETFRVASSSRSAFSAGEFRFISTLCDLVATSIERARLIHDVRRARDLSEQANVAKEMFLASLSHELRTPISPVLLLAGEAINNSATSAANRDVFATIVKNVKLEARLIDDLLDITRINSGKLALDLQVVDLHAVVADGTETVSAELLKKRPF